MPVQTETSPSTFSAAPEATAERSVASGFDYLDSLGGPTSQVKRKLAFDYQDRRTISPVASPSAVAESSVTSAASPATASSKSATSTFNGFPATSSPDTSTPVTVKLTPASSSTGTSDYLSIIGGASSSSTQAKRTSSYTPFKPMARTNMSGTSYLSSLNGCGNGEAAKLSPPSSALFASAKQDEVKPKDETQQAQRATKLDREVSDSLKLADAELQVTSADSVSANEVSDTTSYVNEVKGTLKDVARSVKGKLKRATIPAQSITLAHSTDYLSSLQPSSSQTKSADEKSSKPALANSNFEPRPPGTDYLSALSSGATLTSSTGETWEPATAGEEFIRSVSSSSTESGSAAATTAASPMFYSSDAFHTTSQTATAHNVPAMTGNAIDMETKRKHELTENLMTAAAAGLLLLNFRV